MYKRIIITEFGGPEVLQLSEEPSLPEPQKDEVRVKILASSASFTDVWIRRGSYPHLKQKPPFSPGYDFVGVIDAVGPNATNYKVGQRVAALTITGSYTEYICLPENELTLVPDDVDPVQAVCLILSYMTAYQMLHRTVSLKEGQSILVHGAAGAVGSALVQLGKLHSLKVYATASTSKQHIVEEMGAVPIDYSQSDFSSVVKELAPDGVDAVFDAYGWDNFKRSFSTLKRGGKLVVFGLYDAALGRGGSVILEFLKVFSLNLNLSGRRVTSYDIVPFSRKNPLWFSEDLAKLFTLLRNKEIEPLVVKTFPLSEAQHVHKEIEKANVRGKLVFKMDE